MSAAAALVAAAALSGCGTTTYFAGRTLPPSGLTNRVLVAIQNPNSVTRGGLQIMDAYYDRRSGYNGLPPLFTISGYGGSLPLSIQNMPNEQTGAVYGSGDGGLAIINYASEKTNGSVTGLSGRPNNIFTTRDRSYIFATVQSSSIFTVVDQSSSNSVPYNFSLPGVYRVSVNPGGTAALVFVQDSNSIYYPIKLTPAQQIAYSGGASTWPKGATDCEPQTLPGWCLFQAQDPSTGQALTFDRPIKAVFSADGGTAYVLNCGPECGGTAASISQLPIAPLVFLPNQTSGQLPSQSTVTAGTIAIPGGATNALVNGSKMYVAGQCVAASTLSASQLPQCSGSAATATSIFTGMLTEVTLPTGSSTKLTAGLPISISDGAAGATNRMILADDNTLWIAMTKCTNGARALLSAPSGYGCLTMFNTSTNAVTMLEPYIGDATGVAAVTGLHKIYTAEGGQVYIFSTLDGTSIDNQFVMVTGTATDVAYMDADTDSNNTAY